MGEASNVIGVEISRDRSQRTLGLSQKPYIMKVLERFNMVCTRPDISFAVGMFGRYQSNPGMGHWSAAKKVLRYLKGTRDKMLTYRHTDRLEVIGYL
ncbi:secreted RxLR effector protein 161-like [Silene latifolia]|uniref:secreted RxLR effector protein 161-like n=1 Tax=Silene latifolia TaxID=37657 RepID=UPI003D784CC0